jgi:radical SAM superfamily enzyme YgiQ (UPF0313 family)
MDTPQGMTLDMPWGRYLAPTPWVLSRMEQKMNILLVYPEIPETFWSFKHALTFINKKASTPPLGLVTIAAMLPKEWVLRLIDKNVEPLKDKDILWADFVLVSAMVIQRSSSRSVINKCHQLGKTVVAGGPLFTSEPAEFDDVEHLILNEAEITLPEFLKDLAEGHPQHIYKTDEFADIRKTPAPLMNLLSFKYYDSMSIQFSRGCPFNCDFCNITSMLGHIPRVKTVKQIITELDNLYRLGWRRNVFFVDDNFIGNKKILKEEILPALIEWRRGKIGFNFITETSINIADDDELIDLMVKAGFISIFVGIETPDEASLVDCNKKQNQNRDLLECVHHLQESGIQIMAGFIVGFDQDSPSIFQKQIDFIQESGILTAMVGMLQAMEGTTLYNRLQNENRIISMSSGDNVDGSTNIVPVMGMNRLRAGYFGILSTIFDPKMFYQRIQTFLTYYHPVKQPVSINLDEVGALFKAIFRIGIFRKERKEFWKLFFRTLFRDPAKFPLAITFSIYGYHFAKMTERMIPSTKQRRLSVKDWLNEVQPGTITVPSQKTTYYK